MICRNSSSLKKLPSDAWKLALVLVFVIVSFPGEGFAGNDRLFRIGTGGKTGIYYPVGRLIALGLTRIPGIIGVAQHSAGSVENIQTLAAGDIEAGFVQADVASMAVNTSGLFSGRPAFRDIRAVASLYPEQFHLVVRNDAGIKTVNDLKGKRVSLDEAGSGSLAVAQIVLEAHGLSEKDLRPIYLKPVFTEERMMKGELQGFVLMAGSPMEAVLKLASVGIGLVPVDREVARKINKSHPFLVPGRIPAYVYPGVPETPTLEVHALMVVRKDMDPGLVYDVTARLWHPDTLELLGQGHPKGKDILLENALTGLSIPLHEGSERFYREQGMIPTEKPEQ